MSAVQAALTLRGDRTTAQDVGNEKVMAASSIANIIKSSNSLGAVGLDKMMVEVEHPADKVLVAVLQDGTASVVMAETQDVSTDFDVNAGTYEFVDLGSEAAGVKDKVREKNSKAKEKERCEQPQAQVKCSTPLWKQLERNHKEEHSLIVKKNDSNILPILSILV